MSQKNKNKNKNKTKQKTKKEKQTNKQKTKKKKKTQSLDGGYILRTKEILKKTIRKNGDDWLRRSSMVKKWAGKFKLGRKSLEDNPRPGRSHNAQFCQFFHFQVLEGNWLCLII